MRVRIVGFCLVFCLLGCSSDDSGPGVCGDGEREDINGLTVCVFEGGIMIETGFDCPAEYSVATEVEDVGVACSEDDLDGSVVDEIRRRYFDSGPDPDAGVDDGLSFDVDPFDGGSTGPALTIVSPTANQEVSETLEIRLETRDFELVEPGGANTPNEGSIRVYIDDEPIVPGDTALTQSSIDVRVCSLASDEPEEHTLEIVVHNNDGSVHDEISSQTVTWVMLPGGCGDDSCAFTAGCRVAGDDGDFSDSLDVSPLDTVECFAEAADDVVMEYDWTFDTQPNDSTTVFTPNSRVDSPSFFVDLAGVYEITVEAGDGDGEACGEREITVMSVPCCEQLHVQLIWGPTDDPGDLDLHLLRDVEGAMWSQSPDDCYYENRTTSWGDVEANQAELDLDDDAHGPENINLDQLETDITYRIGAVLSSDPGNGAVATIRVYLDGVVAFERDGIEFGDEVGMCEVATVLKPDGEEASVEASLNCFESVEAANAAR